MSTCASSSPSPSRPPPPWATASPWRRSHASAPRRRTRPHRPARRELLLAACLLPAGHPPRDRSDLRLPRPAGSYANARASGLPSRSPRGRKVRTRCTPRAGSCSASCGRSGAWPIPRLRRRRDGRARAEGEVWGLEALAVPHAMTEDEIQGAGGRVRGRGEERDRGRV